jgi:Tfp pilus assembly protein PilW
VRLRSSSSPSSSAPRRCTGAAGVTIVELAITTALLLVVLLAAFNSFDTVSKSQAYQADRTQNLDDMRGALNRMTRELRQATSVTQPAATPSPTITYVTYVNGVSTTIVYAATGTYSAVDGTCSTGSTCSLTRKVGTNAAFTVLTHLASNLIFTATSATDVTGIQWVEIDLSVNPARSPSTTLTLQSKVNLRNRTASLTGTTS